MSRLRVAIMLAVLVVVGLVGWQVVMRAQAAAVQEAVEETYATAEAQQANVEEEATEDTCFALYEQLDTIEDVWESSPRIPDELREELVKVYGLAAQGDNPEVKRRALALATADSTYQMYITTGELADICTPIVS